MIPLLSLFPLLHPQILVSEQDERPSLQEALDHPWLEIAAKTPPMLPPQSNAATAAFTKSATTIATLQSAPGPRLDSEACLAQAAASTTTAAVEEEEEGTGGPPDTKRRWSITDFEVGG